MERWELLNPECYLILIRLYLVKSRLIILIGELFYSLNG